MVKEEVGDVIEEGDAAVPTGSGPVAPTDSVAESMPPPPTPTHVRSPLCNKHNKFMTGKRFAALFWNRDPLLTFEITTGECVLSG